MCLMRKLAWAWCVGALCLARSSVADSLVISEIMAVNESSLADEDGDFPDWIELQNVSAAPVALGGWHLTDDAADPDKWTFPATNIAPAAFLVVFASNKDRAVTGQALHTNFKLSGDGEFLGLANPAGVFVDAFTPAYPPQEGDISYGRFITSTNVVPLIAEGAIAAWRIPSSNGLGTNWTGAAFDDADWARGPTPVGFDVSSGYEDIIATDVQDAMYLHNTTCYLRMPFVVGTGLSFDALSLGVRFDDGFIAYINGNAVMSANAPVPATWNSTATADRPDTQAVTLESFLLADAADLLIAGTNVLAIHGLNRETVSRAADFLVSTRLHGAITTTALGELPASTPGLPNDAAAGRVHFEPTGCTFAGGLTIALSSPGADVVIRYTLDRTEPTASSPVYLAPFTATQSRMVRARAFSPIGLPGPVRTEGYLALAPDLVNFSSDLPIAIVETFGAGDLPGAEPKLNAFLAVFEPVNGRTVLTNAPVIATRIGVRRRGETSMRGTHQKPNLAVEARGETNEDRGISLMGLPSDSDWVFFAPWYFDRALMRNPLAMQLMREVGPYASRTRFCEVLISATGATSLSYASHYAGLYSLMERIKRGDQRIDIAALDQDDNTEPDISGGYIFKRDKANPGHVEMTAGNEIIYMVYPSDDDITTEQRNWLKAYLDAAHAALTNAASFTDPVLGYAPCIDVPNWIDNNIVNMLTGNIDWPNISTYMHKDRGGKWRQGAAWDFDRSMESLDGRDDRYDVWDAGASFFFSGWWNRLFADPSFWQQYIDRWSELNRGVLSADHIAATIDGMAAEIEEAQARNFAKWPQEEPVRGSWQWEVEHLKDWLTNRVAWINAQFLPAPVIAPAGGRISAGEWVTPTIPPGASVYYTLDGSDPRAPNGSPSASATLYAGPFRLWQDAIIVARAWDGQPWQGAPQHAPWGPPARAVLLITPAELAVTEVMYHPRLPDAAETAAGYTSADFEFIELQHTGTATGSLYGVAFTDGITFDFAASAASRLGPGEFVVVARNPGAFTNRYPGRADIHLTGPFDGSLRDAGERVRLETVADGAWSFTYGDGRGWPTAADGGGHSLVPLVMSQQAAALDYGGNWRASAYRDGSPGEADPLPPVDVVINEFMAHTDYDNPLHPEYDSDDWIELFNMASNAVSLAGWFLSDDVGDLRKWELPAPSVIPAGGWLSIDEVTGFHSPITNGFGLNKAGEAIFLSHLPGSGMDRVADAVRFRGQLRTHSEGRYPDGGTPGYRLAPTRDTTNAAPEAHLVIGEIMYHPAPTVTHPEDNANDEYVEIWNPTTVTVDLWSEAGMWRLDGQAAYAFPAGTRLAPNERLAVVPFNPSANPAARAAFLAAYDLTNGEVRLLGPFVGKLDNRTGRVALERPEPPDLPGDPVGWVIVDESMYFDRSPWPDGTDGTGRALQRHDALATGREPASWLASLVGTPGAPGDRVALADPAPDAVYFTPASIPLRAVFDPTLISNTVHDVTFFLGTNRFGIDSAGPYAWTLAVDSPGSYPVSAALRDDAGLWTSRVISVHALGLENREPVEITDVTAKLAGALHGGLAAELTVYWGETDGGTNTSAWARAAAAGWISNAAFSVEIAGLEPAHTYHYRAMGRTAGGDGWAPATASFATRGYTGWSHRLQIAFRDVPPGEPLIDFPALVVLGTNIEGFSYAPFDGTWASLRFTDASGSRLLNHDVDTWTTNGDSIVWVQIPVLTNGTAIQAYWGDPAITSLPPYALDGSAWRANYEGVWHLGDEMTDASRHGHDAQNAGGAGASGRVGRAITLDGVDDYIDPTVAPMWYGSRTNGFTVSLWVKPISEAVDGATVFGASGGTSNLHVNMKTSFRARRWGCGVGDHEWVADPYVIGAWQMLALVLSNGTVYASLNDGPRASLGSYAPFTPAVRPLIGRRNGGGHQFAGAVDEVRLSAIPRSATWIRAAYQTVANHAAFTSYAAVQLNGNDLDGDGIPDDWERAFFGDINMPPGDPTADWDNDGMTNEDEYRAGTNPTNAASVFALGISRQTGSVLVELPLRPAVGIGYEGLQRFYDLESASGAVGAVWLGLPDFTNVAGRDGILVFTNQSAVPVRFFRARAWLE